MKHRDPRRILHNNIAKTNGITQPNSQGSKDHSTNSEQQLEQHQTALFPFQQGGLLSNMTQSSNINSKTMDPVSNSQLAATAFMAPAQQASSSNSSDLRLMVGPNGLNPGAATNAAPATTPETGEPVDPYGAVDHLLGGYDEQQKGLIQKEKARRIEEQRELFRARKLCLVLDLDHTLLNSAKVLMVFLACCFKLFNSLQSPLIYCILVQFGEVDPIHDEILRKEEQDRCFQDRHLYRLQHMAMWTKLRPGIWNFLRKVCFV
jgi:RNA polymerase II C-terminal domain phosphatase-like 3/4